MAVLEDMVRARLAGQRAARAGTPRDQAPYRPDAPGARERMLWRAWAEGYDSVPPTQR